MQPRVFGRIPTFTCLPWHSGSSCAVSTGNGMDGCYHLDIMNNSTLGGNVAIDGGGGAVYWQYHNILNVWQEDLAPVDQPISPGDVITEYGKSLCLVLLGIGASVRSLWILICKNRSSVSFEKNLMYNLLF